MKPEIADRKPAVVSLTEGEKYFFCSCGKSAKQPFCDGSHKDTDFKPMVFTSEKSGDAYLCQCKHSNKLPYCDGSHKNLEN